MRDDLAACRMQWHRNRRRRERRNRLILIAFALIIAGGALCLLSLMF